MPKVAAQISEYGFSYCQYSYSLPRPVSELFQLFMMINYPDYIQELGLKNEYVSADGGYNQEKITTGIQSIVERWRDKYPELKFDVSKLKFDIYYRSRISKPGNEVNRGLAGYEMD
jgi:hypothetical protein